MQIAGEADVCISVVCYYAGLCWWIWRNEGKNIKSVQNQRTFCGEKL